MANTDKLVKLEQLTTYDTLIKQLISTESCKAVKAIGFSSDGLKMLCYKTVDKSDTPVEVDVPVEFLKDWFVDFSKTSIVDNFAWSAATYPNTTDPSLDGKPVMVFALSKGEDTAYYFTSKISTKEGNGLSIDTENGGLYVNAMGELEYANDDDINALFADSMSETTDNTEDNDTY